MSTLLKTVGYQFRKHLPEILIGSGIITTLTGTVVACKATLDAKDIFDNHKKETEKIEASKQSYFHKISEEEAQEQRDRLNVETVKKLAVNYAPSASLILGGTIMTLAGYKILSTRYAQLSTAFISLENAYMAYRRRVREDLGEKKDREYMLGAKTEKMSIEVTDKNGKTKTKQVKNQIIDPNGISIYARFYDEGCKQWTKSPEYNLSFVKTAQGVFNEQLVKDKVVWLNDVYKYFGIPETEVSRKAGWIYDESDPESDNFIDFGIYQFPDFVNGYENVLLMDFNCMQIDDKVFSNANKNKEYHLEKA